MNNLIIIKLKNKKNQKCIFFTFSNNDSYGQVGHLNFLLVPAILIADYLDITCPHFNTTGGLPGPVASFDTGHTNTE